MQKVYILLLLFLSAYSFAQSKAETEKIIRSLEDVVIKGILNNDTATLKTVWAPDFMVNTPRNSIASDRATVFQIQKAGLIDYSLFERTIEEIHFRENVVITMGQETFISRTDIPGAKAGQRVKRRFTNIWMKVDGRWQQIARHASNICAS